MKSTRKQSTLSRDLLLLLVCVAILLALSLIPSGRVPGQTVETYLFEESESGLSILPASCPSLIHTSLTTSEDGKGFYTSSGQGETGATATYAGGTVVCVTNTSGANYYIPAGSTADLNAFKAAPPSGVSVW